MNKEKGIEKIKDKTEDNVINKTKVKPIEKTKDNKSDISLFKIIKRILPMAFTACPVYFIFNNLVGIIHGASHGFNTFITQKFFDSVTNAVGAVNVATNGSASSVANGVTNIVIMATALGLTAIGVQVLNGVHNFMSGNFFKKATGYLTVKINGKTARINPIAFENTELLDDINKAAQGMGNSLMLLFTVITIFTFYLPYFLFMSVYLFSLKPILAVSIVLIFIPVFISQLVRGTIFAKLEDKSAPIRREYEYYEQCICSREYFKETRLLGAFSFFKDLYVDAIELLSKEIWKAERKTSLIELGMKFCTLVGYMGVLFLLVDALLKKEISVGAFAAVFSSIGLMFGIMDEIVCRHIGNMTKNLGTVRNFVRFLDLPERSGCDAALDVKNGIAAENEIVVENVSFSYPLADTHCVKDISVSIEPGETIAIVGENGAGKSTLVKLLTGLYLPSSGQVYIGGLNTSEVSPYLIYRGISGVFQNYQQYKMTLSENVNISDIEIKDAKASKASKALANADFDVDEKSFTQGMETMLSREFDGVDLSGGQWQRLAIARGLYRKHNIIVLDEPTAAIDPIEETKIYKKFAEISKGVTSIIVTHRLGSAKIADRIIVMDSGSIVEIGTHEQLVMKGGKYNEMWNAQAQFYV